MIRKANKAVFGQYLKNVVDCTVTSSNPSSPLIIDGHGWLLYQITSFTGFETYGDKLSPYVSCVFIQVKMGPLADRVGVSNMQLTALTAGLINHSGGDVDNISLSKSTTRRSRATAREMGAAKVKENFSCKNGQINFDGKLLTDLGGFGKVRGSQRGAYPLLPLQQEPNSRGAHNS